MKYTDNLYTKIGHARNSRSTMGYFDENTNKYIRIPCEEAKKRAELRFEIHEFHLVKTKTIL